MTNYDLEEVELLNWQFILSSAFIVSIIISLTLTYNQILRRKKEPPLYDENTEQNILVFNRILATSIAIGFLLINIKDKSVRKKYDDCDEDVMNMQIWASAITLIATLIVLYIALNYGNSNFNNENPEL